LEPYDTRSYFDEMFARDGAVRPAYGKVGQHLGGLAREDYFKKQTAVDVAFMRGGVTFTVYNDNQGTERIFPFDLIPRVIPAKEWAVLEAGLIQRLTALNLFLRDIYHEQRILKERVIPAHYVLSARHFRREFMNFSVPKDVYVHICGTDLIRDHDGRYLVLEDNLRCPSGASYMLENRAAMKRAFPSLYQSAKVRPVENYAQELLKSLQYTTPVGARSDMPTVVLLTPGVHNSAYFEHSFLARQMGVELVEGSDLVCHDNIIAMRTTEGLQRVDVVYRRIDDDYLDPLHFRGDSVLGCPGTVNAARAGTWCAGATRSRCAPPTVRRRSTWCTAASTTSTSTRCTSAATQCSGAPGSSTSPGRATSPSRTRSGTASPTTRRSIRSSPR
jgi:uncharacterized circularly permuted ATP-grasp superfamily protein